MPENKQAPIQEPQMPAVKKAGHLGILIIVIAILIAGVVIAYLYFTSDDYTTNTSVLNSYTSDNANVVNTNTLNSNTSNSNSVSITISNLETALDEVTSAETDADEFLNDLNAIDSSEDDALTF